MRYIVAELMFTVKKVSYEKGMICLLMSDKKEIRFPIENNTKLKKATEKEIKNIEIICNGTGLHWPDIDEDLSITGIIEGNLTPSPPLLFSVSQSPLSPSHPPPCQVLL